MFSNQIAANIESSLARHTGWRSRTLNLIASENALSPRVRSALDSDLLLRYADYPGRDPAKRRYRGNRFIADIEKSAVEGARRLFKAEFVELRPIGGHLAGLAVLMALCKPGDTVFELGREAGGHREAGRLAGAPLCPLDVRHLPFDGRNFAIDLPAALQAIEAVRPRAVILGSSNFLFPHPVREIAEATRRSGGVLIYDASHVMGFLAAGQFQAPLEEGADIVFGSTHKTLPGPQGGLILSNRDDLMEWVTAALVPGLVTNHHPFRFPALGLAFAEMMEWGSAYMTQTRGNAQSLGSALARRGLRIVMGSDGVFTRSHTLLLSVAPFGPAEQVAERLEHCGIIVTSTLLPDDWGKDGIRIGVQEMTRFGATRETMEQIADLIADALHGDGTETETLAARAAEIRRPLGKIGFTWNDD